MTETLDRMYEVVYYNADGRVIYWPADRSSSTIAQKLREARLNGHANARIVEVA